MERNTYALMRILLTALFSFCVGGCYYGPQPDYTPQQVMDFTREDIHFFDPPVGYTIYLVDLSGPPQQAAAARDLLWQRVSESAEQRERFLIQPISFAYDSSVPSHGRSYQAFGIYNCSSKIDLAAEEYSGEEYTEAREHFSQLYDQCEKERKQSEWSREMLGKRLTSYFTDSVPTSHSARKDMHSIFDAADNYIKESGTDWWQFNFHRTQRSPWDVRVVIISTLEYRPPIDAEYFWKNVTVEIVQDDLLYGTEYGAEWDKRFKDWGATVEWVKLEKTTDPELQAPAYEGLRVDPAPEAAAPAKPKKVSKPQKTVSSAKKATKKASSVKCPDGFVPYKGGCKFKP